MKSAILFVMGALAGMTVLARHGLAHNEDKPGPLGGFVRMPGAFHVEVVPTDSRRLTLYLEDINFQNPATHASKVTVTLEQDGKYFAAACTEDDEKFKCELPSGASLALAGQLRVEATRLGASGAAVVYPVPLKLTQSH